MKPSRTRQYRRVAQACENCRRKKIRCPGQKPTCSTCKRLGQCCAYADSDPGDEVHTNTTQSTVDNRLTRLEQKLDLIIGKVDVTTPEATLSNTTPRPSSGQQTSVPGANTLANFHDFLLSPIPGEIREKALDVYFERIHRQPLWLFESDSYHSGNCSEELSYILLALGLTLRPETFTTAQLGTPDFYSHAARRATMLKVADGTANLQTAQALCLIAFFDVISGSSKLTGLNISLAKNILQCYGLGSQADAREESKLFWNLHLLEIFYGPPSLIPTILDISSPYFSIVEPKPTSLPCPSIPRDSAASGGAYLTDIWPHCLRLCSMWGGVRTYISKGIEGLTEAPWRPESDYVKLSSMLLDLEMTHPSWLSYNGVKFSERDPQEVSDHKADWLPWMRSQVTYHTIHCVLNHPFLYTSKTFQGKPSGNSTFWRSSSDKAQRHSNWISRLIRLAGEKGLTLHDPFFAQAAGIAGTLHLYWTYSSDDAMRASAKANLAICQSLVTDLAERWPVCKVTERALSKLADSITMLNEEGRPEQPAMAATKPLMWSLLDVTAPSHFLPYSGDRFRHNRAAAGMENEDHEYLAMNDGATDPSTPVDRRESTAHYASPPAWAGGEGNETSRAPIRHHERHEREQRHSHEATMIPERVDDIVNYESSWGSFEHMMMLQDNDTSLNWWEFDNL